LAGDDGAHRAFETHMEGAPVIATLIQGWRLRQRWLRAEVKLILQGKALCRAFCDGDKGRAGALFDAVADGKDADPVVVAALVPFFGALEQFRPMRMEIEKNLTRQVKQLPIYAWAKSVKGFGTLNLIGLIGEAGDIAKYRNPSCLWKRLGLAVIN